MRLPDWMRGEFEKGQCPYCKKQLTEKGVQTHGIREEKSKVKKKIRYAHFYDYKCQKCKRRSIFSFPTSFKEFIQDMMELASMEMPAQLDGQEDDSEEMPDFAARKSCISDEEVAGIKDTLDNSDDLKDFFRKIGIVLDTVKEDSDDDDESK